jgi:dihydropteroate synthase
MTGAIEVMGVLNVTPDSFSDGGHIRHLEDARHAVARMVIAGADIIDVGGESTRPGASPVTSSTELARVIPVIQMIRSEFDVKISVDTSTPEVMLAAVQAGAYLINDVRALSRPGAVEAAAQTGAHICLMHMQGQPGTMQQSPQYADVVKDVYDYLIARIAICEQAGIVRDRLLIDPGFGFGKTLQHNIALLQHLERFVGTGFPVVVGMSRKSMIGDITGKPTNERMIGSVAAAVIAATKGATIVRVHDVAETKDAMRIVAAIQESTE